MTRLKIVSGGQTGVDRAALDVGLALGLAVGGECPKGRRAEDGVIPGRYPLVETPERSDQARTKRNIEDSNGTLILNRGTLDGGTALTARHVGLALAGPAPSARDRREFRRMSAEKVAAVAESWNAMVRQTLQANQTLALSFLRAFWSLARAKSSTASATRQAGREVLDIVQQGLAPVHRRAVANAKRLSRTTLK